MSQVLRMSRKSLTVAIVAATIAWSIGLSALVAPLTARAAAPAAGSLVKASQAAVYYVGSDGKRYVFPNEKTYKTWYSDFSTVVTITDAELAALPIGGNVTYRPGVKMVKIQTDPKVYAVDAGGALRWVTSEALAVQLYGSNWNTKIDDVSDAFFVNYKAGADISTAGSFNVSAVTSAAVSINSDKGLSGVVTGSVSAALALDNPAGGSIIAGGATVGGQGYINMLKIALSGTGKVTKLVLSRTGISSDSDIDNAYLYEGNTLVAEMSSMSAGKLTFMGSPLVEVMGSKTLWVAINLNRAATAGKTLGLSIVSASDITLEGGSAAGGSYPLAGNLMTVAAVTDLGRLTVAGLANSATVDPGTVDFEAMKFTLQSQNQDVKLTKLSMKALGSINSEDLSNFKLFEGATQVGSTVAAMDSNKMVSFDLSSAPYTVVNGTTRTFSMRVDVKGGSTRTIQFSFQKPTDVVAWDSNYNVGIVSDTGTAGTFGVTNSTSATVNAGSLTVNLATSSPTGNVALNATNVLLAKYELKAIGEAIKVTSMGLVVSDEGDSTGPANGSANWANMRNVRLMYNGVQVGTTQTSVTDDTLTTVTVNFTVAAGTTGVLEVRGDIACASVCTDTGTTIADTETIRVYLDGATTNGQRVDSLGTLGVPSADVAGNNLTVATGALTAARNAAYGSQTLVQSTSGVKIASFLLSAGSAEGVAVSSITVRDNQSADAAGNGAQSLGASFTNLKLKKADGTQLGQVIVPNTGDAIATTYTFNLSPALTINANETLEVNLFADALSNADATWITDGNRTQMSAATGTGLVTSTATAAITAAIGQPITVQTAGQLSLATDSSTPVASQMVMGGTAQTIGIWKFSANNVEDITISQLIVTNENAAGSANVKNLKLYVGGSQVGATVPAFNGSNQATFSGLAMLVPKAGDKLVTLKADLVSFTDGATAAAFVRASLDLPATITGVGSDTVIANGASGQFATTPAATDADANDQYAYRTSLTATLACSGGCTGRTRASSDVVGKLTLTGTSTGDAQIRPAMQVNDDSDDATAGNNWQTVNGGNANAVAVDTAVSVDGNSISWTATTDFDIDDLLVYDLPATADMSGFSRVSFWLQSVTALAGGNDLAFFLNDTATTAGSPQQSAITVASPANTWVFVDMAMPAGVLAADDFFALRVLDSTDLVTSAVKIDEVRFYNDSIVVDVSGNLCLADADCVAEDGAATVDNATGLQFLVRDSGGTTRGVGYYNGTATVGTVRLTSGNNIGAPTGAQTAAQLTPAAGLISLGGSAQVFDLVTNTNELVKADTTATEVLSLSMDLGNASTAGDFLWFDQAVTATSPINWMNAAVGTSSPISVSLGY